MVIRFLFLMIFLLQTSTLFALDLTFFEGTWKNEEENRSMVIRVNLSKNIMSIKGLTDYVIFNRGSTQTVKGIEIAFDSSIEDSVLFIMVTPKFSLKTSLPFVLSFMQDGKDLKLQIAGIKYKDIVGLSAGVETLLFKKIKN